MKVVVAPQAFKGTASAAVVAAAMSRGVLQAMPHSQVVSRSQLRTAEAAPSTPW